MNSEYEFAYCTQYFQMCEVYVEKRKNVEQVSRMGIVPISQHIPKAASVTFSLRELPHRE